MFIFPNILIYLNVAILLMCKDISVFSFYWFAVTLYHSSTNFIIMCPAKQIGHQWLSSNLGLWYSGSTLFMIFLHATALDNSASFLLGCLCLFYHSSFQLSVLSNIFLHVSKELCLFLPYKGSIFGFHLCAATRNTVIISLCWVLMVPSWLPYMKYYDH